MIRTAFVLLFCLVFNTVFAGTANISGTITNRLSNTIKFSYYTYDKNWLQHESHKVEKELDKKGSFSVNLPVAHDYTSIRITNGTESTEIYISPGSKLNMTVDCEEFDETVVFEGKGADIANLMAKYTLKYGLLSSHYSEVKEAMMKDAEGFLKDIEALTQDRINFLIQNSPGLPQSFVNFWDKDFEYRKYNAMLDYPYRHEVYTQKKYDVAPNPDNFYVINEVPAQFDDQLMSISSYREYITKYYEAVTSTEENATDDGSEFFNDDNMLELAHKYMPKQSEEYVYASYIENHIKYSPFERTEYSYNKFSNRYEGSSYSKYLEGMIEQKRKLMPGQPAIDFIVKDDEGNKYSLKDLKGKVIYLDFWASWCGPCKAQFPHTKKLKEHFKGKDVVFAYISVDENEENWEKAKKKYHLTGLHALGEKAWQSKVPTEYGVRSIPSYFLIDKEGKFVLENTPRPSQKEKLIKAIESVL